MNNDQPTQDVRRIRCTDRAMTCVSCKARATYFVLRGERIWFASCARHVELHERRTKDIANHHEQR